jgi:glycerol kinase
MLQVFAAETSELLTYHQIEILQMCPREGWVEQDPLQILKAVKDCMEITVNNLHKLEIDPMDIVAIGITNQRETVVVWDRYTGQPLYNAIGNLELKYNICIFQKCS